MQTAQNTTTNHDDLLPDFCHTDAVVTALIILQLVALVLTLAGRINDTLVWQRLLLLSLYLHWIGLSSAAALCQLRRWVSRLPQRTTLLASYALLIAVTFVISETAWEVAQWRGLQEFLPDDVHIAFVLRNLCISAVVSALILRYFWLQHQSRRQAQAEAEARYQVLQARIRPHFLFNSLNSIAELVATRPKEAETAVEDLAQLFRAGLYSVDQRTRLREELEVTRAYLRTESLRLGDRLRVHWTVEPGLEELPVPSLCLQPLVENAVIHGVAPMPEGGEILIDVRRSGIHLQLEVRNPVGPRTAESPGSGVALDNIRQRLRLMYGARAGLITEQLQDSFVARLLLPVVDKPA